MSGINRQDQCTRSGSRTPEYLVLFGLAKCHLTAQTVSMPQKVEIDTKDCESMAEVWMQFSEQCLPNVAIGSDSYNQAMRIFYAGAAALDALHYNAVVKFGQDEDSLIRVFNGFRTERRAVLMIPAKV